jgi:hypothetical protein
MYICIYIYIYLHGKVLAVSLILGFSASLKISLLVSKRCFCQWVDIKPDPLLMGWVSPTG